MKAKLAHSLALLAALTVTAHAQTINWGSEVFSDLADSNGVTLDSMFVFELGAFSTGYTPSETNVGTWLDNWQVFDRASYSPVNGYFSSAVQMEDNGTSNSAYLTPGAPSFAGLEAYLWIRKGDDPVPGSEWLLTRATEWTFPQPIPGCCDNGIPLDWSVSDLNAEVPLWGHQGGIDGPGAHTDPGPHDLQTYTFVPEASTLLLALLSAPLLLRRRRD